MRRILLILVLLTFTTCATRPPVTRIAPRQIGTTRVEFFDGRVQLGPRQYEPIAAPGFLVFWGPDGVIEGINNFLIANYRWAPDTAQPEVQRIADN